MFSSSKTNKEYVRYDKTNELAGVVVGGWGVGGEKGLITRKRIKNTLLYLSPREVRDIMFLGDSPSSTAPCCFNNSQRALLLFSSCNEI
jgi:hypothetical protein